MSYWPFGRGLNEREQLTADVRLRAEGERLAEADTVLLWGPEDRGCAAIPADTDERRIFIAPPASSSDQTATDDCGCGPDCDVCA